MSYNSLSCEEEAAAKHIVDAAYKVHKTLGPGLLEKVYETCFCHELAQRNLVCDRQLEVKIEYEGLIFKEGLRLDVLVEKLVICELKTVEVIHPVYKAQLLSYMKLTGKRLGFLINTNVPLIKNGITRLIL